MMGVMTSGDLNAVNVMDSPQAVTVDLEVPQDVMAEPEMLVRPVGVACCRA
jgi:hypothetical protein